MTGEKAQPERDWGVAVFVSRETEEVVLRTVQAIAAAADDAVLTIDLLVNGNPVLAAALATRLAGARPDAGRSTLRLWSIRLGDKAHAWNEYIHRVWSGHAVAFNVDGYARPLPDALALLARRLDESEQALAAAGTPSTGRSSAALRREMSSEGGLHGNLFALPRRTVTLIRERGFRMPLGLYRTDALLGAVLSFGMDPAQHAWGPKRYIVCEAAASWQTDPKRWWDQADVRTQVRRFFRQAQGALENMAVRDALAIRKLAPERLPTVATEMVLSWIAREPAQFRSLLRRRPLSRLALRRLHEPRDWSAAAAEPQLLLSLPAQAG